MAEFNLFEHHHDHGHDHSHGHAQEPEVLDPAQRSLADALRVSFTVLKLFMVGLVIVYAFSGIFNVPQDQQAVRLRFGKFVGARGEEVLQPGGPYLALPYPLEEHLFIPTTNQTLKLDNDFWYYLTPEQAKMTPEQIIGVKGGSLDPEQDGSMITGDANIIHAKWTVKYVVSDPVKYLENVGDMNKAHDLVLAAVQEGAIHAVAQTAADAVVKNLIDRTEAQAYMQKSLDAMRSGLTIKDLSTETSMPLPVIEAYRAVTGALGDQGRIVEEANQKKARILGETAGEAWRPLQALVDQYELADLHQNETEKTKLNKQLDDAFYTLLIGPPDHLQRIGGEVAKIINDAQTYRSRTVDQLSSEAARFDVLLPQYNAHPQIVLDRLWADTKEVIFGAADVQTFYLPPKSQVFLDINQDPKFITKRETARLKDASDKAKPGNQ